MEHKEICKDNFVGTIELSEHKLYFEKDKRKDFIKENSIEKAVENQDFKNIVIILESPHISEYEDVDFIAPAIGKTGELLQKYFYEIIINYLSEDEKYNVILMNAVQYQCSSGENPVKHRDENWCCLWFNDKKKDDFAERLKSYRPDIIINACTIGKHTNEKGKNQEPNLKYVKDIIKCKSVDTGTLKKLKMKKKYSLKGYVEAEIININFERNVELLLSPHPSSWFNKNNRKIKRLEQ